MEPLDSEIPPSARVVALWGDPVLEALDEPMEYHKVLSELPLAIRNVICVELLHWQVLNGGFWQYFYNPYGITVEGAIQGFAAMGLKKHANLVQQARASFGEYFPEERLARMNLVGESVGNGMDFRTWDDAFYLLEENDHDSAVTALDAYATAALKGQWQ